VFDHTLGSAGGFRPADYRSLEWMLTQRCGRFLCIPGRTACQSRDQSPLVRRHGGQALPRRISVAVHFAMARVPDRANSAESEGHQRTRSNVA
jgi:hypothetical protein